MDLSDRQRTLCNKILQSTPCTAFFVASVCFTTNLTFRIKNYCERKNVKIFKVPIFSKIWAFSNNFFQFHHSSYFFQVFQIFVLTEVGRDFPKFSFETSLVENETICWPETDFISKKRWRQNKSVFFCKKIQNVDKFFTLFLNICK